MKPFLLRFTAAAATVATLFSNSALAQSAPIMVQTPPAARPAPPPPGPVMVAMSAMLRELGAATPASMPPQQRLDALLQFRHSAATAAQLAAIYGSTPPWTLSRLPTGPGAFNYRAVLSPLHYVGTDGGTVDWAALPLELAVSADGSSVSASGAWPQLVSTDKAVNVTLRGMTLVAQQRRSSDHLWLGSATIDIAHVEMGPGYASTSNGGSGGPQVVFDGVHTVNSMREQGNGIELGYLMAVRRIGIGGDGIDNFKLATRVTAIDRQSMVELQAMGQPQLAPGTSVQQRQQQLAPFVRSLARGVIRSSSAIEIDELSASFHGQTLRASGHIGLAGAVDADADNLPALLKKLVVRLSLRAPTALLREASTAMAGMQIRSRNQGQAEPQAVAQLAASMYDIVLGKMVASGFVRVDGDTLVSDIDYQGGSLRLNGKVAPLPTMPVPTAAGARASNPAGAGMPLLQARRIDAKCALPAYPAEVIKNDAPLSLTMRLLVKADGSVHNVTVTTPSAWPDYDRAVLAAAERCVYIPALRNGQPVDVPAVWKVVREAGSAQP